MEEFDEVVLISIFYFLTTKDIESLLNTCKTIHTKNLFLYFREQLISQHPDIDLPDVEDDLCKKMFFSCNELFQIRLLNYWKDDEVALKKHQKYLEDNNYIANFSVNSFVLNYLILLPRKQLYNWRVAENILCFNTDKIRDRIIAMDDVKKYEDYFSGSLDYAINHPDIGINMIATILKNTDSGYNLTAQLLAKYFIRYPNTKLFDDYFARKKILPCMFLTKLQDRNKDIKQKHIDALVKMEVITNEILLNLLNCILTKKSDLINYCSSSKTLYAKILLIRYAEK